jgi:hypothetical protein
MGFIKDIIEDYKETKKQDKENKEALNNVRQEALKEALQSSELKQMLLKEELEKLQKKQKPFINKVIDGLGIDKIDFKGRVSGEVKDIDQESYFNKGVKRALGK